MIKSIIIGNAITYFLINPVIYWDKMKFIKLPSCIIVSDFAKNPSKYVLIPY